MKHPALVWTLLMLFGLPNLLGQGFHIAIHHAHHHGSACGTAACGTGAAGCAHGHSHVSAKAAPAKRHSCKHHRHSHAETAVAQRDAQQQRLAPNVSERGHDPHNCSICQYFATAQALANPISSVASVDVTIPLRISLPAAVFSERYLASSPRGPPAA